MVCQAILSISSLVTEGPPEAQIRQPKTIVFCPIGDPYDRTFHFIRLRFAHNLQNTLTNCGDCEEVFLKVHDLDLSSVSSVYGLLRQNKSTPPRGGRRGGAEHDGILPASIDVTAWGRRVSAPALSVVYCLYRDVGPTVSSVGKSQMCPLSFPSPAQFLQAMESAGVDNLITARPTPC
jgi:hypothetical protein